MVQYQGVVADLIIKTSRHDNALTENISPVTAELSAQWKQAELSRRRSFPSEARPSSVRGSVKALRALF